MVSFEAIPEWLRVLLGEKFFNSCLVHESEKKNEENSFCLDCCVSLCLHCLPSHTTHCLLQIRRYVYQDVLPLKDAEKLMDCSSIQSYITNSAKVLFLKQRPISRQMMGSGNSCVACGRNLQDPYLFCSIFCKVNYSMSSSSSNGPTNSRILSRSFKRKPRSCTNVMPELWPSECTLAIKRRKNVPRRAPLS